VCHGGKDKLRENETNDSSFIITRKKANAAQEDFADHELAYMRNAHLLLTI